MPLTLVQRKTGASAADVTTQAAVFDSPPVSGNLLLAYCTSGATVTMASSGWTLRASTVDWVGHYHWQKVAGGSESSTVTVTPGAAAGTVLVVEEWSGNTASPFDVATSNSPAANNQPSVSTGTTAATAQADEVAVAAAGWVQLATNWTVTAWSNSFTQHTAATGIDSTAIDSAKIAVATRALAATGTQTTTATFSGNQHHPSGLIATYKAAAAGKPPPFPRRPHRGLLMRRKT